MKLHKLYTADLDLSSAWQVGPRDQVWYLPASEIELIFSIKRHFKTNRILKVPEHFFLIPLTFWAAKSCIPAPQHGWSSWLQIKHHPAATIPIP
jgi:hypothetical protein